MKNSTLILVLALIVYCAMSFFRLADAPVCMPHESGLAAWIITVARINGAAGVFEELKIIFFGMDAMKLPFVGNAQLALQFLISILFGASLWTVRASYVFFSFVSLLSIFYVLKRWFDNWVGVIVVVLLAIDPVFITFTRFGAERDEIFQICLFWTGLALIELSAARNRKIFFYASGFLFGLALWAKLLFLGYLFGVIALLICAGSRNRRLLAARYNLCARDFFVWALFWIAGMFPLVLYNVARSPRFKTFRILWHSLVDESIYGRNNLDLVNNIVGRFRDLWRIAIELGAMQGLVLFFPFVCFSVGRISLGKSIFDRRVLGAVLFVYAVCFFLSSFVPTDAYFQQLLILWPVFQIVAAVSLRNGYLMISRGYVWKSVLVLAFMAYCASLASCTIDRIHSGLRNRSGNGMRNMARSVGLVQEFLNDYPEPLKIAFTSGFVFEAAYVCADDGLKDKISLLRKNITEPTLLVVSSRPTGWPYESFVNFLNLGNNESELLYFYNDIEFDMRFYVFRIAPRKTA